MHYTQALELLLIGNRRYVGMQQLYPRQTMGYRQRLVKGQRPFAAILSCSDSRVPSELIFDQGLGDLFIVRTAGHAVNELVLASLEYAIFALYVPLVMVLGHAQCGAITSVMEARELPGNLPQLMATLRPAVAGINLEAGDAIEQAVRANSRFTAAHLSTNSDVLGQALSADRLKIVPAYYDLGTGRVEILS
jgi:carbonic anhydrase